MARCHRDEAESSWLRHLAEDVKSDDKERGEGGGGARRANTAVDESRNEMIGGVARYWFN